jgi:hypothetical protein
MLMAFRNFATASNKTIAFLSYRQKGIKNIHFTKQEINPICTVQELTSHRTAASHAVSSDDVRSSKN